MFGYIKPFKPEMKICEYETYKAVYCGLCKQLGKSYGPFSRLTLSFDFTFLAILDMAMHKETELEFSRQRCIVNPLKKSPCCGQCQSLDFSSGVAMIMFYYKVLDNYNDGKLAQRALSILCLPFAKRAYHRAAEKYPEVASIIYETISRQSQLEQERCSSTDLASEPSALALSGLLSILCDIPDQKRVLERFGYLIGRFVYLSDALDDLEQDVKQNSYNPFLVREDIANPTNEQLENIRENAKGSLFLTIAEIIKAYELLELTRFKPILDNIVYLGLKGNTEQIFSQRRRNTDGRSI